MTLYLTMMKTVYWPFDNTSPEPSQRGKVSSTPEEVWSRSRSLQTPLPWLKASRRNIIPQKRTEFTLYRGRVVFPDGAPPPCLCSHTWMSNFICLRACNSHRHRSRVLVRVRLRSSALPFCERLATIQSRPALASRGVQSQSHSQIL